MLSIWSNAKFCRLENEVNSLPNDKILDMTKLKAFADDKLKVAKMRASLFDRAENTAGKGENAGNQHYQHFLLFSLFSKAFFYRVVKSQDCIENEVNEQLKIVFSKQKRCWKLKILFSMFLTLYQMTTF